MNVKNVKIVTFVPTKDADKVRQAFGDAGAGALGDYSHCSYSVIGKGRNLPGQNADPHIGEPGKFEVIEEERIEVICPRNKTKQVIEAMKAVHPYEEVAFDIIPLLELDEL